MARIEIVSLFDSLKTRFRLFPAPVSASRSFGVVAGGGNDDPLPFTSTTQVDPAPPLMVTGLATVRVPTLAPGFRAPPAPIVSGPVRVVVPARVPPVLTETDVLPSDPV